MTPGQQAAADESANQNQAAQKFETVLLFRRYGKRKNGSLSQRHQADIGSGAFSAIVLLPEIALTAQVVDVFIGRFGEQVAVLHSKLSEGERHDEWRRMQEGAARIVVGARSAIFAPVQNVGLIVVDEEHEASYKQDNTPRYNAKDLAAHRAQRLSDAVLILGSATPSLESYYATEASGEKTENKKQKTENADFPTIQNPKSKIQNSSVIQNPKSKIVMPERIDNRPLPKVHVVDLREEFKQRKALFLAGPDGRNGADGFRAKQQIILFLNRRGYAQFVLCRDCGYAARCPNCAVSLAFHSYDRSLKCHHCEFTGKALRKPALTAEASKVKAFGIGTEKVEEEVLLIFPSARVARLDRDTTAAKGAHTRILRAFRSAAMPTFS